MKLSEMRRLLSGRGIRLTKSLGQNFLHEEKVIAKIAAAGELAKADKVLEIGPGLGPLTELLLAQAGEVLAIEVDARLVEILRNRFPAHPLPLLSPPAEQRVASSRVRGFRDSKRELLVLGNLIQPSAPAGVGAAGEVALPAGEQANAAGLNLIHADAVKYLKTRPRDWSGWKLVANLPYSAASPILVELALAERGPDRMVATMQLEVARRLRARAGDDDYGLLALLVQLNYEPRAMFRVPAGCFFPRPKVDSACLTLARRPQPPLTPAQTKLFARVVKQAFSQRRKTMAKLLRAGWPGDQVARALSELGLAPEIRAEAVTLEQFAELAKRLAGSAQRGGISPAQDSRLEPENRS